MNSILLHEHLFPQKTSKRQNKTNQLSKYFDFDYLHENSENRENRGMSGEMMVGGLGSVKERDADVDVVIAKVRQEIEAKAKVSEI